MLQSGVMLQSPRQRECNWTAGAHFLRTSKCSGKNAFRYPVSELLNYKKLQKP